MADVTRPTDGAMTTWGTTQTPLRPVRAAAMMLALLAGLLAWSPPAFAVEGAAWVRDFWPTARSAGISRATYDRALRGFQPDPDVLRKAANQPEFNTKIWTYVETRVSDRRITRGRELLEEHADLFGQLEARYGVDRYTIAAIWGMESNYGAVLENERLIKQTIPALATLASSGGRLAKFGRQQLIAALKIVERGDVHPDGMVGSWAGAMGHTQFIPTTFEAYGVDFDGDGRRNVWTSVPDALGSAASYLNEMGWRSGQTWGYEVIVPRGYSGPTSERSIASWMKQGIRRVAGREFARPGDTARLYRPAGANGPSFLLIQNFKVIKRYNNSDFYALAIGHLSDRLRGGDTFVTDWPPHEKPLDEDERKKLQILLTMLGHYDGEIDGAIGSGSREAIRAFQRSAGLTPDGVDSRALLKRLEQGT